MLWVHGADRNWWHADERRSVIAGSRLDGTLQIINSYDEYGRPGSNGYRFRFTGQPFMLYNLLYLRNRVYDVENGRFLQTDPIGYGDGMNWYAYAGGDPVNFTDPSGLCKDGYVTGSRIVCYSKDGSSTGGVGFSSTPSTGFGRGSARLNAVYTPGTPGVPTYTDRSNGDIVVTAGTPGSLTFTLAGSNGGIGHNGGPPIDDESIMGNILSRVAGKVLGPVLLLVTPAPLADGTIPKPIGLPNDPTILGHIFRNAEGHYPRYTVQARSEIMNAVRTSAPRGDQYGNTWYYGLNSNGTQTWVRARAGVIRDAGVNQPGYHRP